MGTSIVWGDPALRKYVFRPIWVGCLTFLIAGLLCYPILAVNISNLGKGGQLHWTAAVLTSGLYILLWVTVSAVLFLTVLSLFSSLLWDSLSIAVEQKTIGSCPYAKHHPAKLFVDSLARGSFSLGAGLLALCCGALSNGVLAVAIAGFIGLLDYSASAYIRRGILLRRQLKAAPRLPGALSFIVGAGLLTLIPGVNFLMLPSLVAGATLMVIRGERPLDPDEEELARKRMWKRGGI